MTLNARICLKSEILVYFLTYYVINVSKELCILKLMMIKVDLKHRKLVLLHFLRYFFKKYFTCTEHITKIGKFLRSLHCKANIDGADGIVKTPADVTV